MESTFNPTTAEVQAVLPSASIDCQIASGGQKVVFKAQVGQYGIVALKLIRPGPTANDRTLREVEAASKLSGPHFSKIHETGEINIKNELIVYIIEEFLSGETLRDKLIREKHISEMETVKIGAQLLEALIEVEKIGLVHRDLKPENIMLIPDGRVVLLDFGIARHLNLPSLTADAVFMGPLTPGYGAPEQIKNEKRKICNRTDLFAWAIIIYECVSGCNPFRQGCTHAVEVLTNTLILKPAKLTKFGANKNIAELIDNCLNKAVHRRPPSAKIVFNILKRI